MLTFILSKSRIQRIAWKILIEKADGFVQYCSNKERTQFYGRNGELPIRDSLHLSPLAKVLQKIAEKQNKVRIDANKKLQSRGLENLDLHSTFDVLLQIKVEFSCFSTCKIDEMREEFRRKSSRIPLKSNLI